MNELVQNKTKKMVMAQEILSILLRNNDWLQYWNFACSKFKYNSYQSKITKASSGWSAPLSGILGSDGKKNTA